MEISIICFSSFSESCSSFAIVEAFAFSNC